MSSLIPVTVYVQDQSHQEEVPTFSRWEYWFGQWLQKLKNELPKAQEYELTLCLTDNKGIQVFNAHYRHKNQPTDVLAFASLETPFPKTEAFLFSEEPLYLGDIIISVEKAKQQAIENEHSLTQELAWLAAHGLLHLLGWDHPDEDSLLKMLAYQETLLAFVRS